MTAYFQHQENDFRRSLIAFAIAICLVVLCLGVWGLPAEGATSHDVDQRTFAFDSTSVAPSETKALRQLGGYDGPALVVDVNVRMHLERGSSPVTVVLERENIAGRNQEVLLIDHRVRGELGDSRSCGDTALILTDEEGPNILLGRQTHRGFRRPIERLQSMAGHEVAATWRLRITNHGDQPVRLHCAEIDITELNPSDGVYHVTESDDVFAPSPGGLTFREAVRLADADGMDSRVLFTRDRVDLSCAIGGIRVLNGNLTISGGSAVVRMPCAEHTILTNRHPSAKVTIEALAFEGGLIAIRNEGYLELAEVDIADAVTGFDNRNDASAQGLRVDGARGTNGAIHHVEGNLHLHNAHIEGNTASRAPITVSGGVLTITGSVVANNAGVVAGGVHIRPGASAFVVNTTFDGNVSSGSGAGALYSEGNLYLLFVTLIDNASPAMAGSNIEVEASVVANSIGGPNCDRGNAWFSDYGASDDASCGFDSSTDLGVVHPHLQRVAVGWYEPAEHSPLVDVVPAPCEPNIDQVGNPRAVGSPGCDVGAVERLGDDH